uniref:LisH domain-containing protein n=1 Tax=Plectus sambesii TaxID=2011161 RepID=A0A914UTE8_9BILA
MITKAVKDYLEVRGFTTIASLKTIPPDAESLLKYLTGCPDIATNLSVRRGLRCLLSELPTSSNETTSPTTPANVSNLTHQLNELTLQPADKPIPAPRNIKKAAPTTPEVVKPAPNVEQPKQTLSSELKSEIDNYTNSSASDFLKQQFSEAEAALAEAIGVKQFQSLAAHAHERTVVQLQQEVAKIDQGKATESSVKQRDEYWIGCSTALDMEASRMPLYRSSPLQNFRSSDSRHFKYQSSNDEMCSCSE